MRLLPALVVTGLLFLGCTGLLPRTDIGQPATDAFGVAMPPDSHKVAEHEGPILPGSSNIFVWMVSPLTPDEANKHFAQIATPNPDLGTFDTMDGGSYVTIYVTAIEEIPKDSSWTPIVDDAPRGWGSWIEVKRLTLNGCPPPPLPCMP
ncbi:MAG: hypothetical protein HN348_32565 [Proteobacteria bacterium]|jgi:hypothetical protein|nr:hypothetical protein [Pseudomonadota bacterium]